MEAEIISSNTNKSYQELSEEEKLRLRRQRFDSGANINTPDSSKVRYFFQAF